jgi:acetylornithine deacetylase/succinyl-diaminopimelate desuccinylase-like protein
VEEPAAAEIASWKSLPFNEKEFLEKEVGSKALTGDPDRMIFERIWSRPTLEIHGIAGGFTGAGAKTVIPATATAKVSMRLVPAQDPVRMFERFSAWVAANAPEGTTMEVRKLSGAPATVVNPDHPAIAKAAEAFRETMSRDTVFIRSGGSIPIVGEFAHHLGIPTVLMGLGLPDDGLHSPNEKYKVDNFYLGIRTVARFFELYGA